MNYHQQPPGMPGSQGASAAANDSLGQIVRHGGHAGLRHFRTLKAESQTTFWARFGVSQSSGCRFELGVPMPATVALLLRLYADGKLSDADLCD